MTDRDEAFFNVLREHLQPLFSEFMDLQMWARICVSDLEGDDELVHQTLTELLPGFFVSRLSVDGSDFANTWTPRCRIELGMELKGQDLHVEVNLTCSDITDVAFVNQTLPKELGEVDLVKEFQRKHLLLAITG
jgi:hypothetical protein